MHRKLVPRKSERGISRRDFARWTVLAAAAVAVLPGELFSPEASRAAAPVIPLEQQPTTEAPNLSPEGLAEVNEKVQAIFRRYGSRLSAARRRTFAA